MCVYFGEKMSKEAQQSIAASKRDERHRNVGLPFLPVVYYLPAPENVGVYWHWE